MRVTNADLPAGLRLSATARRELVSEYGFDAPGNPAARTWS